MRSSVRLSGKPGAFSDFVVIIEVLDEHARVKWPVLCKEVLEGPNMMQIAPLLQKKRWLQLPRPFAFPYQLLQKPMMATFISKRV
jgi:hypothetical protein